MITQIEIQESAREWQLPQDTVEKDYVLGWLIAGIAHHAEAGKRWVFKGGTCLKKCFFETYRFSEDLDFSLVADAVYTPDELSGVVRDVCTWTARESGITFFSDEIRMDEKHNLAGQATFEGRVYYRAALPRGADQKLRIKLDLTKHEIIVDTPVRMKILNPYSEPLPQSEGVLTYSIEELTAEKIRALYERARPRDLYDVVHLFRNYAKEFSVERVREILRKKCEHKKIAFPTLARIMEGEHVAELRADWDVMLRQQLAALPDFESFWGELRNLLGWLEGLLVRMPRLAPITMGAGEVVVRYPTIHRWGMRTPMEVIRFAGANRLCVRLLYNGKTRIVEPYSFRRTKEGNITFYAHEVDGTHIKQFRVDRIQAIEPTNISFAPRYVVEF